VGEHGAVAGGHYGRFARAGELVDHDAAVASQAELLGELRAGDHAHADHHQVRGQDGAVAQAYPADFALPALDGRDAHAEQ